jgi:hypothetical protein
MESNTQYFVERFAAIFIFTLIISGNFLAELFPCKIQEALSHNILIKHIFGFLTLFFFGILAIPELANVSGMVSSLVLYIIFLINAKTKSQFWIAAFVLYAMIYMLHIVKKEYDGYIEAPGSETRDMQIYKDRNKYIEIVQNTCMILIGLLTTIGFFTYMGEKKIEYGGKFSYHTFFLGKPKCRSFNPSRISIVKAIKTALFE